MGMSCLPSLPKPCSMMMMMMMFVLNCSSILSTVDIETSCFQEQKVLEVLLMSALCVKIIPQWLFVTLAKTRPKMKLWIPFTRPALSYMDWRTRYEPLQSKCVWLTLFCIPGKDYLLRARGRERIDFPLRDENRTLITRVEKKGKSRKLWITRPTHISQNMFDYTQFFAWDGCYASPLWFALFSVIVVFHHILTLSSNAVFFSWVQHKFPTWLLLVRSNLEAAFLFRSYLRVICH